MIDRATVIAVSAMASLIVYRDPPAAAAAPAPTTRSVFRAVLLARDLWLLAIATGVFAGLQTVWMSFLVLYLQEVVRLPLLSCSWPAAISPSRSVRHGGAHRLRAHVRPGLRRAAADRARDRQRELGALLDRARNDRRGAAASWLLLRAVVGGFAGIGWNGVQHTMMAELAGPAAAGTAVGLGLAISSTGVAVTPPLFGWSVELAGAFRGRGSGWRSR